MLARLQSVRNWIFDLDNTLYPAGANLFAQIEARMGAYIARRLGVDLVEAKRLQKRYFHDHGTTLAGLMAEHGVDPHEFLDFVHDVEMDVLTHDAPLAAAIARLPGRRIVFTNGDAPYAARVLARLGLAELFDAVHDLHAMRYVPKPQQQAYVGMVAALGIDPAQSLFAEDMARNLVPAKAMGMTTLWIDNGSEQGPADAPPPERAAIDFITGDLTQWLTAALEG